MKKTLHSTQQLLVKEDPSKTTQPDFIHTLVTEHTAQLREKFLRDRASAPPDYDSDHSNSKKDELTVGDDDERVSKNATKKGKGKAKDDNEDFASSGTVVFGHI